LLAAEKERKAGKPGRGSPVLAVMMRKIFVWRAMERRAKEEPLGSELTIESTRRRGGSLSEILIKLYKGRREPEILASLAAGILSRGESPESPLNQRI